MESQLGIGWQFLDFGDESGGVTGALLEIRRGGSDEGMVDRRLGKRFDELVASKHLEGLAKEEDEGLAW